ncbi:MAG TPA: asparagine synthase (glutamine-hydrolyzing) [Pyrinomonadaceae bacterium]|nr:asparagine synthase (glutamine-hydrolyzing) [Pyrinomonadaceae bacterium]
MCGITGYVTRDEGHSDRSILERMTAAIAHRGPDDDGFFVDRHAALGMRRLAIIDIAGGHQPIHNQDRSKWIIFNGEIYNYQELREGLLKRGHQLYTNSDTEAVLHLYEEYGADCVEHLRGMYAFAIWDTTEKSLFAARDRVGKKPFLYSYQPNGDLIFGSEFRALLEHPVVSRDVDYSAIDDYMSYMCVPAPKTAYLQIRKLEPGHWLKWKDGQIQTKRYWQPDFSKKIKITEKEAIEETTRLVRESTRLRMISEVPLGAFLSGGVDSSIIVALMAQLSDRPVKTFSIGFEEEDFSELRYAKRVAEHVGAEYNEFVVRPDALEVIPILVDHYGEPFADSSMIPTYYVAKETRRHVTVALNGDGGDESFAGYERYVAMKLADKYLRLPAFARKPMIGRLVDLLPSSELKRSRIRDVKRFLTAAELPRTERFFRWVSAFDRSAKREMYTAEFADSVSENDPAREIETWLNTSNGARTPDPLLLADLMTYLPNDLLVKVDIASMANSLEARSPLLDHNVIEFAASLPAGLKMRGVETKSLLKKVAARLVPREVVYRQKMGFGVPIGKWFRTEMREFVRGVLLSGRALDRGIIRPEILRNYVDEHTEGRRDHSPRLWSLLMLELWFQRFID